MCGFPCHLLLVLLLGDEPSGRLALTIVEKDSGGSERAVPARVHLLGPDSKPVRAPGLPFFHDHLSSEGSLELAAAPGRYSFVVERGPEYRRASGSVEVAAGRRAEARVVLERWIDLAGRGWWSGETHVHRPIEEIGLLLRSEDLHAARRTSGAAGRSRATSWWRWSPPGPSTSLAARTSARGERFST